MTIRRVKLVLSVFSIFSVIYAFKTWISLIFGLNHQVITLVTFSIIFLVLIMNHKIYKMHYVELFYLSILAAHVLTFAFYTLLGGDPISLISSIYVFMRQYIFVAILTIRNWATREEQDGAIKVVIFILFLTFCNNLLIHPIGLSMHQSFAQGNIQSGNGFGVFRANGLLGGTVIDYATFLTAFIIISIKRKLNFVINVILFFNIFMNFSRSVIIAYFLSMLRKFPKFLTLVLFIFVMSAVYIGVDSGVIAALYNKLVGQSDFHRLTMWIDSMSGFAKYAAFGYGAGSNTGLFFNGMEKVNTDSFILGHSYDLGLVTTFLFCAISIKHGYDRSVTSVVVLVIFFFALIVNSGFEKLFNACIMAFALGVCRERA